MQLIVFDCDGTLVDSQNNILIGLRAGFKAVDLPMPDRETALSIVGLSLDEAFEQLVGPENAHLAPKMSDGYREEIMAMRAKGSEYDPLYPGTLEMLEALSQREDVLLGIATGKHSRGVKHIIETHDLHGKFVTIQTADKAPSKPHPAMLMQAMEETGVSAENTVMIGDTSFDMEMARNAKVAGIGVDWGYHEVDVLHEHGAAQVISDFDQLYPLLCERFSWV